METGENEEKKERKQWGRQEKDEDKEEGNWS